MRSNSNSLHVVRSLYGGWVVRKYGSHRAMRRFTTKQQAVDWGRALSRERGADFVIHREDGTVQEATSRVAADSSLSDPPPTSP